MEKGSRVEGKPEYIELLEYPTNNMIINCIGIGLMRRKARIDRDSEDWNQVQQAFWFVLCLFFFPILEFVLHSISSYFKFYDHYSIIEMIFDKLHIEVF